MEPLTFPLTHRDTSHGRAALCSEWAEIPSTPKHCTCLQDLRAQVQSAETKSEQWWGLKHHLADESLGARISFLSTRAYCCLGFVDVRDQGQRVQHSLLAGLPLRVSQGVRVGYPMLTHGTLRWLYPSKLSLCTERPESSSRDNVSSAPLPSEQKPVHQW